MNNVNAQNAKVSGHATRGRASEASLQAQPARITAQIVVRDKDGNVKYEGPLVMQVQQAQGGTDGSHT